MKDKKYKGRVLLVYPNPEGYGGIPNGLALLSGTLRDAGFDTKCFDTTFLNSAPKTHFYRQKHGGMMKVDHTQFWGEWTPDLAGKIPELFSMTIEEFQPDLIAITLVDVCYHFSMDLLTKIKAQVDIPIVAGGVTVTMSPELIISNDCIDAICLGEGEDPLVELANCIVEGKDYSRIANLWVKKDGKLIKNPLRALKDMNQLSDQDWSIFDLRHYYKPYCGTFRRTGFFELARGCPFNCSFCITASLRRIYGKLGKFLRTRSVDKTLDEVVAVKDKYDLELIFFIDDNFLGMPEDRFDYFCQEYKKRVDLPFYIQTRSETVREDYVKKLKDINISTIAIGVEHGHEELRRIYLNRKMDNANLERAFNIVHKYGIRSTANIIIGMPYEEEGMFAETLKLLRKIQPKSVSINYFQPYRGTLMRDWAVELGYIDKDHIIDESNTCLDMPEFRKERIIHYYENFSKYLDGELEVADQGYTQASLTPDAVRGEGVETC